MYALSVLSVTLNKTKVNGEEVFSITVFSIEHISVQLVLI